MVTVNRAYLLMHLAILLWGFTGIFGKAIEMGEGMIVWYRMFISAVGLLPFIWKFRNDLPSRKEMLNISGVGFIVAVHWILFYGSIKASSVSVALSCFSSVSLFTALLDPLMKGKMPKASEMLLGLAVIAGIYLIFRVQELYLEGILLAVGSAFFGALFTVWNKNLTAKHHPEVITFYELASGFIIFTLLLPVYFSITGTGIEVPNTMDILYLVLLGVVCTSFAFTISLKALKVLDPFTLNLSVNLEPIYSIVLAMFFFNEREMFNPSFLAGTAIILGSVVMHSWLKMRQKSYLEGINS